MTETGFLVGLLVVLALGVMGLAIWDRYLILGRAIQSMRYDLDAAGQTLKWSSIVDGRVADRVTHVTTADGKLVARDQQARGLPAQPPDPNVRTTAFVNDAHEIDREANRVVNDLMGYAKRDSFAEQPLEP